MDALQRAMPWTFRSAMLALSIVLGACTSGAPPTGCGAPSQRLFERSCAACHGSDARGHGPVAPFLTVPVPDLTLIAARRDGVFPEQQVYSTISGLSDVAEPGARHMPIWGYEYFDPQVNDELAHRRAIGKVQGLVRCLRELQR